MGKVRRIGRYYRQVRRHSAKLQRCNTELSYAIPLVAFTVLVALDPVRTNLTWPVRELDSKATTTEITQYKILRFMTNS
jgi:hypothetical protein